MDFFKLSHNPSQLPFFRHGQMINGIKKATWIERYRENGEFTFVAPVSSNLRNFLPEGSYVSHFESNEIMVVENHEIVEEAEKEPLLTITGRSLEVFLEQRIIGARDPWNSPALPIPEYKLSAAPLHQQIVTLITNHISDVPLMNPQETLPGVGATSYIGRVSPITNAERVIPRGDLYNNVLRLLEIDDLGLKVNRPNRNQILVASGNSPYVEFLIHNGIDRSSEVLFSLDSGEISNADYLFSLKRKKTAALVTGKYVKLLLEIPGYSGSGFDRRVMYIDATDIDESYQEDGMTVSDVYNLMYVRGENALKSQKSISIVKPNVPFSSNYAYRKDYNIGDVVSVMGNYGVENVMRVVAYVEIEDDSGEIGYPTLSAL